MNATVQPMAVASNGTLNEELAERVDSIQSAIDLGLDALGRLPRSDTLNGHSPQEAWELLSAARTAAYETIARLSALEGKARNAEESV